VIDSEVDDVDPDHENVHGRPHFGCVGFGSHASRSGGCQGSDCIMEIVNKGIGSPDLSVKKDHCERCKQQVHKESKPEKCQEGLHYF